MQPAHSHRYSIELELHQQFKDTIFQKAQLKKNIELIKLEQAKPSNN